MKSIILKKYNVVFKLKSPLHIGSGKGEADFEEMLKHDKTPFIPGSTIKGKLKENFIKLTGERCCSNGGKYCGCPVCTIFGNAGYQPARIFVEDFKLKDENYSTSIRPRVSIDRYLRTAVDGGLSGTEVVENGVFEGTIKVFLCGEYLKYERELVLAMKMIDSIGGGKSRGFGFVDVEVKSCE